MAGPYGGGGGVVMEKRRIDVLNVLKYGMLLVIIAYIIVLVAREGGDAPMETVKKNVAGAVKTDGMKEGNSQDFKRYYGLNADDYEEVFLYVPEGMMDVSELLIVRLKSEAQEETVREAAQKRLDTQTENFEGYGTEQTKLLKSAILESRGSYVFMAVGKDADKAYRAFKKSL